MSSNELYQNPIAVDITLAAGTANVNLYTAPYKWYSPNTSKVVGVFLKTAGANTAPGSNNASNVSVNIAVTPNAVNVVPAYTLTVKNNLNATDVGVYTVLFVNENKVSNYGSNIVYPC